jgi:hypothetical protein
MATTINKVIHPCFLLLCLYFSVTCLSSCFCIIIFEMATLCSNYWLNKGGSQNNLKLGRKMDLKVFIELTLMFLQMNGLKLQVSMMSCCLIQVTGNFSIFPQSSNFCMIQYSRPQYHFNNSFSFDYQYAFLESLMN